MTTTWPLSGPTERPPWLPWSAHPFPTRFTDVEGTLVHFVDEGSGPPLLFVSAGQWSFMFRDVILRLRNRFRCLALDFPGCGLSAAAPDGDHSVQSNALVLRRFVEALDLHDITMVVHDIGGPVGLLVATQQPQKFRALVITNTFAWPLAGYPAVRRMLRIVASPQFGAINRLTNLLALFTATSCGVGRRMSRADRSSFLGPWRSRGNRVATQRILAGALGIDPLLAEIESSLETELHGLPVLTLFGRKNDRYGWQRRFHHIFPGATAVAVDDGHHFPFDDDPQVYAAAINAWWTAKVNAH